MIISLYELFNIVIMTLAVAFIFRRGLKLEQRFSFWQGMAFAASLTAPAIILHEFGHKGVALAFGLQATFMIPWPWLGLGVVLALFNSPFIFFVPAYISVVGTAMHWQDALISFAGPAVNGILYLIATLMMRTPLKQRQLMFWAATKRINGFLFIFNMIPIPPFDGYGVFSGLLKALGL